MTTKFSTKEILEIIGVVAVVISLIFVGYQLQQSNRIAERDARAELNANFINLNDILLENPELTELLGKHRTKETALSPAEVEQSRRLADLWFQLWASVVVAYDSGYLPEFIYQGYRSQAVDTVSQYPGMAPYFKERVGNPHSPERNTTTFGVFLRLVVDQIDVELR